MCVCMCVLGAFSLALFFCLVFSHISICFVLFYFLLDAYLFSKKRGRKDVGLEGSGGIEELERVGRGKTLIRMYYIIYFQ